MDNQQKSAGCRGKRGLNRREFIGVTTAAAAGMVLGLKPTYTIAANNPKGADTSKIVSYNSDMEYRLCGKTGWMVSAVCLGGHWKRLEKMVRNVDLKGSMGHVTHVDFLKNRYDVVTRCIDRGINFIDACTPGEIHAYCNALKGRRDKMYLGWSWCSKETRNPEYRTAEKLMEALDAGLKETGETYVDLWRIMAVQDGSKGPKGERLMAHMEAVSEEIAKALAMAKKQGKARCTGVSCHDKVWLEYMIKTFPDQLEAIVAPYTAKTKMLEKDSLFDTVQKYNVGFLGIKPFASNSIFKGDSGQDPKLNPHIEEDNRMARLTIRYILCNPAITAPIPGMISEEQVDNVALAINERRELDAGEKAELNTAMDRAWANLPREYQWLRKWEYV